MFTKKLSCVLIILTVSVAFFLAADPTAKATAGAPAGRAGQPSPFRSAAIAAIPGPGIAISERESNEYSPAIAYNSKHDEYLVVWENIWPGGHHDVYAQRIAGDGRLLSWFAVSTRSFNQMEPSVAYDPTNDRYLVVFLYDVWGDGSDWDVWGRFIPWQGPNPALTDFTICDFSTHQGHPVTAFAYTQQEFLVAWVNFPGGAVRSYISARRIFADGSGFPAGPFVVSSGTEDRDFPDLTYNLARNEYLVVWDVVKASTGVDIYGIRLSGAGTVLTGGTPPVVGEFPIAGWPAIEEKPAVAACAQADQYLVTWQSDKDTGGTDYAIYARYLNGDAALAGVYLIADTGAPQLNADVACNAGGGSYLIVWQDKYVGGEYGIWGRQAYPSESMDADFEVYGPRHNADRQYPAIAGGRVSYLVAWEHDRDGGTNLDIYGRLLRHAIYLPLVIR